MSDLHHAQLGLSDNDVLQMYETMLLARRLDERMWLLNRAGKIPFVISCQGHEVKPSRGRLCVKSNKGLYCTILP